MKRILLFVLTNLAVILVLTVVLRITGLDQWLTVHGQSYGGLLVFATVFGFGGAFISLLISKWSAKRMMGVQVIEHPESADEVWLLNTVRQLAQQAGIGMPEVGVFESDQPNAFATGPRRDAALVAVSTGLLRTMNRSQLEAVLGHEITHVANGDMVTLTLIQGVVNTFVIFLSRVVGSIVDRATSRDGESRGGIGYFVSVMVAQLVLGFLASMIVAWFSRWREFRADAGGAKLAGSQNMIAALQGLQIAHDSGLPAQMAASGISGGQPSGWARLFMSHPPIPERVAALQNATHS
ncbi:MAG: protease HtpX [Pseudomonadota bacterium]|jgi:heat shock protein HtpX